MNDLISTLARTNFNTHTSIVNDHAIEIVEKKKDFYDESDINKFSEAVDFIFNHISLQCACNSEKLTHMIEFVQVADKLLQETNSFPVAKATEIRHKISKIIQEVFIQNWGE